MKPARQLTRRTAIGTAIAAACAAAIPRYARAIHFGDILEPEAYPAVGLVEIRRPQAGMLNCGTGSLIAPDLALTVAHVVANAATPFHIRFRLDGRPGEARAFAYSIHPDWRRDAPRPQSAAPGP